MLTEKPQPGGLALAFQEGKPGQSHHEAVKMARPGPAYLGLAWPGSRPQAGPCTALTLQDHQFSAAAVFHDMGHRPVSITHFPPSRCLITHPLLVQHAHTSSFFLISCFWTRFTIFHPCSAFLYISLNTASFSMSARSFTPF